MTGKLNGARAAVGAEALAAPLFNLNSFKVSQQVALEAAKFSARRMRAYADQWEALARCDNPQALFAAQADFLQQMQADYAAEGEALKDIISEAQNGA